MTYFTAFWYSTPHAQKRSASQQHHRQREKKRRVCDPDTQIRISVPRHLPIRKRISRIKRNLPYKLRRPEIKQLQELLVTANLDCIILPKQRTNNGPLRFDDARIKFIDEPKGATQC